MRTICIITFIVLMMSCGMLRPYTDVTYDPDTLNKYDELTQMSKFNHSELDTLVFSTKEIGVATYEWTIHNKREVKDVTLIKNTFSDSLEQKFRHAIMTAEQIPFEDEGLFSRVITIRIKSAGRLHVTWSYPKRVR